MFIVPVSATNMDGAPDYLAHVLHYLRTQLPYYDRSSGTDHVWFCSADHGGSMAASIPGVREGIVVAHYFKPPRYFKPAATHSPTPQGKSEGCLRDALPQRPLTYSLTRSLLRAHSLA